LLLPLIAIACYLFGAVGLAFGAYYGVSHHGRGGRIAGALIAAVGIVVHVAALAAERRLDPHAALSLGDTAAIVSVLIAVTALALALRPRLRGIAALLLVIAAVLEAAFSEGARSFTTGRPGWPSRSSRSGRRSPSRRWRSTAGCAADGRWGSSAS
jgi:ABC-type uncharacterized transport system permease subunit